MISLLLKLHIEFDDSFMENISYSLTSRSQLMTSSWVFVPVTASIENVICITDNFRLSDSIIIGLIQVITNLFVVVVDHVVMAWIGLFVAFNFTVEIIFKTLHSFQLKSIKKRLWWKFSEKTI